MKLIFSIRWAPNYPTRSYNYPPNYPPLILVIMARPAQTIQNNTFAKSLEHLKKEVRDEGDFLCRWVSQLSINWYYRFGWVWRGVLKVLKITIMQYLCKISINNWVVWFCMLINLKVFSKLIASFLMGLTRHAQIARVILQYLCDIVRKKSGMSRGLNCTSWLKELLQFIIHLFSHHWLFSSLGLI